MIVKRLADAIISETEKIIIGKQDCIRLVVMAILSGGHVLINDLPGVGKTTMVKAISLSLGLDFKRVQFVSDMLPSDIMGMRIFNRKSGEFELRKGPIMTNLLLADEINRAIPRTQSALLEAMEERQVTIDGESVKLPEIFVVLATENPVESESTFPLPSAELDRFMISISMGYPKENEEVMMLERVGCGIPFDRIDSICGEDDLIAAQEECRAVNVSRSVEKYIISIVNATRSHSSVRVGASPRASRALYQAAKAWAAMAGRDYVIPDDVKTIAHHVLDHRIILQSSARFSSVTSFDVIENVLSSVDPSPDIKDEIGQ